MSIDYLERILNVEFAEDKANDRKQKGFFQWDKSDGSIIRNYCWNLSKAWQDFLLLPKGYHCLKIMFKDDHINFYSYPESQDGKKDIGEEEILGRLTIEKNTTFGWEDTVRLYLPEEQKVFEGLPHGSGVHSWHVGPMIRSIDLAGWFKTADGSKSHWTMLTLNPNGVGFSESRFSATIDGVFYPNLDFGKR